MQKLNVPDLLGHPNVSTEFSQKVLMACLACKKMVIATLLSTVLYNIAVCTQVQQMMHMGFSTYILRCFCFGLTCTVCSVLRPVSNVVLLPC